MVIDNPIVTRLHVAIPEIAVFITNSRAHFREVESEGPTYVDAAMVLGLQRACRTNSLQEESWYAREHRNVSQGVNYVRVF